MLEKKSLCKINLLLNILGKRADGYHELETVLHPVDLADELTFERAGQGITLGCDNPALPVDSRNLVHRAAASFLHAAQIQDGVRIHLRKRIPIAAGLGGGSGNAAATLIGLNELFGQPLSAENLLPLASELGSDVPFFLRSHSALATGRGEILAPVGPFPALRETFLVLAHPGFGISTPWAYGQLAQHPTALNGQPGRAARLVSLLEQGDLKSAGAEFYNSLEAPALKKYPLLRLFQQSFRENGALGVLMSGSGSSTFAVFQDRAAAENALEKFTAAFSANVWTALLPMSEG